MHGTFNKFCKEINFSIPKHLEGSTLSEVVEQPDHDGEQPGKKMIFAINFFSLPTKAELLAFCEQTKTYFQPYKIDFQFTIINKNYSLERIYEILDFVFTYHQKTNLQDLLLPADINFHINTNTLLLEIQSKLKYQQLKNALPDLQNALAFFKLNDLKFDLQNRTTSLLEFEEQQFTSEHEAAVAQIQINGQTNGDNSNKNKSFQNKNARRYFKMAHKEFYDTHETYIMLEGLVVQFDMIMTKNELMIYTINITDFDEAVVCKLFVRKETNWDLSWVEKNIYVSVFGEKKIGQNHDVYLQIRKIEIIKSQNKVTDQAKIKRIEFSARSSMSAMDGFIEAKELLQFAKDLNHEAVAIVDFQNIQAFPEIFNNAKQIGIKPIYGATFSVISKANGIITNPTERLIETEPYVIFDIETTSLNPRLGEMIEFGAVEVLNHKIVAQHQFFIKPSKPISDFTTELTGITQEMLDQPSTLDQASALSKIKEIFADKTLVAHNASFDIGYINEKLFMNHLEPLTNQVIDTLALAKFLIETAQNYRLETVAKKFNIIYDPSVAHRADYDALVLQKIWSKMVDELIKKDFKTFVELDQIDAQHLHQKKHAHDLAVYAKNQQGLKELFCLISQSLTQQYYGGPRLFVEDLAKSQNLFFAPASINTYLIDLMFTGTTQEIEAEIKRWDFIGIPAPHLFSHLVARNQYSETEIQFLLKDLVLKAKTQKQIIVAISDVRYLTKNQAIGHHVYINTKGLEGKRHPLYRYNELDSSYPMQHFLTTKEMKEAFKFLNSEALVEEIVVSNTHLLNDQIASDIEVIKNRLYTPDFDDSATKLRKLVYENAHKIYGPNLPQIVSERIKRELEPIVNYGFSVVYWISHKLVAKSNQDGYLVGSRGSVGSSLVATLSQITEVNPLIPHYVCSQCQYSEFVASAPTTSGFDLPDQNCPQCNAKLTKNGQTIPFETFLGFNADKIPDIDLNFSGDYQPIIHQEVKKMFGETHAFRAGTISTVASKTAFGFVKKWNEEKALHKSPAFISYLADMIEGSKRTTGQHPGGIIIIPKEFDVEDFTPINYPANDLESSWKTTHLDFHAIHDNVLKLDLLGHDDPTIIRHLQKLTNVKIEQISFSDPKVMALFNSPEVLGITTEDINGEVTGALGIPEFGTPFVRRMLSVAKPKSFNDLINLSGLSHGTDVWNGNAEVLIRAGTALNEVISCRDDIMIYLIKQGIKSSVAFHIMEKVRKGQGLTKDEEQILLKKNIPDWYINSLKKIKYMFPKAHATAYVMMAWRIAWFKIYYPLEYYAAFLSTQISAFDIDIALGGKQHVAKKLKELEAKQRSRDENQKLSAKEEELIPTLEIINELMARKLKVLNIDLYRSHNLEWIVDYEQQALIPPFVVIDGLGDTVAKKIVDARQERVFQSIQDFQKRCDINKTLLEKLKTLKIFHGLDETDQIKLF